MKESEFGEDTVLDTDAILSIIQTLRDRVDRMESYFKKNFDIGGPVISKINRLEMYMESIGLEPKNED